MLGATGKSPDAVHPLSLIALSAVPGTSLTLGWKSK